jgi:hypothetical protein
VDFIESNGNCGGQVRTSTLHLVWILLAIIRAGRVERGSGKLPIVGLLNVKQPLAVHFSRAAFGDFGPFPALRLVYSVFKFPLKSYTVCRMYFHSTDCITVT